VLFERVLAAEIAVAKVAVKDVLVHRRVALMLFQRLFAAVVATASLATEALVVHWRVPLVLFACLLAAETTVADGARESHCKSDCRFLFSLCFKVNNDSR
jgi:hypothetical protein